MIAGVPLLAAEGLRKRYPNGVLANDGVSLALHAGEVHAIVGENGAGKSTLIKLLYGLEQPDAGEIRIDGRPRRLRSTAEAGAAGIGLVPQHLELVPSMTVAENVVLGAEPMRGPLAFDAAQACRLTEALAQQHGLAVDPRARVSTLAAGAQQRVQILKALHRGARVLLLDEPTALLSPPEAEAMFDSLRRLVQAGLAVALITHKLAELRAVAQRFTVLRAGRVAGAGRPAEVSDDALCELIVGHALPASTVRRVDARGRAPLLQVRRLSVARADGPPELLDVSLDLCGGEILGIAGVEGNGQNRLADVLAGLCAPSRGEVLMGGAPLAGQGARHARTLGVGCVPEDRLHNGVAAHLSIADNMAVTGYHRPPMSRRGLIDLAIWRERGRQLIERFGVRAPGELAAIGTLSGGNMQKLVLGRELAAGPRVLIASQPTRGVDLGAAEALRRELVALRDAGAAVLLISADLDEILALSDRIAVLFQGRLVAHFAAGQATPRTLGPYMTGALQDHAASATREASFTPTAPQGAAA